MTPLTTDRLKTIKDFDSLIDFLKNELDWPLDSESIDDLTFEYEPEELGLSNDVAVNINFIKQLRPLAQNQPWGIFYIDFEPKKLPVVVLRRVLQKLVIKQRVKAKDPKSQIWHLHDLLFINSFGEQEDRAITFAHFNQENEDTLPTLRVVGWDGQDTPLHLDRCLNELNYLHFEPELDVEQWRLQWSKAFKSKLYESIKTSKLLAQTLAKLAQTIRNNATHILKYESEDGQFHKMLKKFKQSLIHDLTEDDFSDMYAQTLAYGLLYTAIRSHIKGEPNQVSVDQAQQLVLPTNPFLKEVMEDFFNIGSRRWDSDKELMTGIDFDELGINDIVSTLKDEKTDFDAILRDFGNKNPNEDPVIHFYESFLKEYDALKRKSRGVYYTPQPVVSFIVRSVHEVLKRDFGLEYGLADTTTWGEMIKKNPDITLPGGVSKDDFFVQILDPAVGTGTFLVETIDIIYKTMVCEWRKHGLNDEQLEKAWNKYVPEKLLPRLYGFELMMAPYAIAHMKIGVKLYETGYKNFEKDKKRVQVYLTNTLEEAVDLSGYLDTMDPAIAIESTEANRVKQLNSINIVIGNPPYAGHSFNASKIKTFIEPGQSYKTYSRKKGHYITKVAGPKGATQEYVTWIGNLIQNYFYVDGQSLDEKNPKWLNDDYVKFIRYSQYRLDNAGAGVLGFITNHAYLDNPTFRGMRQSLLNSFSYLNIVDLHGNSMKKEKCPDGSKDENVFEIQQGVAINISTKLTHKYKCKHADLWGIRKQKYVICKNNTVGSIESETINPGSDKYLLCPQDTNLHLEYESFYAIPDILPINSVGIVTGKDDRAIASTIEDARALAKKQKIDFKYINSIQYRPFNVENIIYHPKIVTRMREDVMRHMINNNNMALISVRQVAEGVFNHVFISDKIVESRITISNKGIGYLYPLYCYPEEGDFKYEIDWPQGPCGRTPNLDPKFVIKFTESVKLLFVSDGKGDSKKTYGPEDFLAYIYAVLHSPIYRTRYADFLKIDFPRVPIPSETKMFCELVKMGSKLISLHLMESVDLSNPITDFPIAGDNIATKVGETGKMLADVKNGKGKLYINSQQYFDKLPEEVWNFHVGGYQVCHKWLADRKGRKLSKEDIEHYQKIVVALNETIRIMAEIDKTIAAHGGWPGAFVSATATAAEDSKART